MITHFYIENFKSFAEPSIINMDDLLVIAGSNSGGKSTLIQALLLLAQTLDNPRPDMVLDLGGRYIQFAEFREMIYGRPLTRDSHFTIGFDLVVPSSSPSDVEFIGDTNHQYDFRFSYSRRLFFDENTGGKISKVGIRVRFGSDISGNPIVQSSEYKREIQGLGHIIISIEREKNKYRIRQEISSTSDESRIEPHQVIDKIDAILKKSQDSTATIRSRGTSLAAILRGQLMNFGIALEKIPKISKEVVELSKKIKVTKNIVADVENIVKDLLKFTFQEGVESSYLLKITFDHFLLPTIPRIFNIRSVESSSRINEDTLRLFEMFENVFGYALSDIHNFLGKIKYIGPLRAKPERAYLSMGTPIDIGNSGENAVPILWLYQNEKVHNKTKVGDKAKEIKLVQATQDWLQEFGIAYLFHITKPKRVIYQAELETSPGSQTMVTIADVGFGVSQLLPVIVAGLRASTGSIIILEQPEIHLHPRLQGKLADFLICLVELDKKIIVETHSEHLINMLRLRIVQDKTGKLRKKIGIIFVRNWQQYPTYESEEGVLKKGSYVENLKVDEYGKIINWPPDFFPETSKMNEEILKAMMDKFQGVNNK